MNEKPLSLDFSKFSAKEKRFDSPWPKARAMERETN